MTKPDAPQGGSGAAAPEDPDRLLRRLHRWLAVRVAAVVLLALALQTALIAYRALAPEGMDLDDEVAAKAEAVGTMLAGPLLTALGAGIPVEKLNGVEPFLASGLQGQHDLTDIALAAPDGRILWRSGQAPDDALVERTLGSLGTAHVVVRQGGALIVAIPLVVDGRTQAALLVGGDPDQAAAGIAVLPLPVPAALVAALLLGLELLLLALRLVWLRPLVTSMRILARGQAGQFGRTEHVAGSSAAALLTRALNAALVRLHLRRAFLVLLAREARDSQVDPAVRQQIDAIRAEADAAMAGVPEQLARGRPVGRIALLRLAGFLAAFGLGLSSLWVVRMGEDGAAGLLAAPAGLAALVALGLVVPPSPIVVWRALILVGLSVGVVLAAWGDAAAGLAMASGLGMGLTLRSAWRRWRRFGLIDVALGMLSGLASGVLLVPAAAEAGLAPIAGWAVPLSLIPALVIWLQQTGPHHVDEPEGEVAPTAADTRPGGGGHAA